MKMEIDLNIRTEAESDYPVIYDLIRTAFETANVKDGTEQDFAGNLRKGPDYLQELALVAESDGKIVGHIMLTKTYVDMENGRFEGLLLAPVSVLLEYRNQGVGAKLITDSMKRAEKMGFKAVFLVGDRNYYSRFGFVPARRYGIYCPQPLPDDLLDNIMACELAPGALTHISGTLHWQNDHELDVESIRKGLSKK